MDKFNNKYILGFILSLIFFISGLLTLKDYGINWDAPFRMLRGSLYASIYLQQTPNNGFGKSPIYIQPGEFASRYDFLDGEEGHLIDSQTDFSLKQEFEKNEQTKKRLSFYDNSTLAKQFFLDYFPPGHPPFIDVLAAFSNKLFYGYLNILGDIESYQLVYILISAIGIFIVTVFAYEITGSIVLATTAGLAFFLNPLFFSESHFNMKDPLQAALFAGAIWSFWHWIKENKIRWALIFGVFVSISLNIKWNIIFLPFILILWLFSIRKTDEFKKWFTLKKLIFPLLLFLGCIASIIIFSPDSWQSPLGFIFDTTKYYFSLGTRPEPYQPTGFILPLGINLYPTLLLVTQTPIIVLVLATVGIFSLFKNPDKKSLNIGILLTLWLIVPIIRVSLPHVWFYNGLRQIMEVVPSLAILSTIGIRLFFRKFKDLKLNIYKWAFIPFILILLTLPIIKYHPNENLYFNALVGGFSGATKKNLVDKKISYGNIYKQAAFWLNKNAPPNSKIALLDGPMYALSPQFLRADLNISPFYFSDFDQTGEYILSLYDPENQPIFAKNYPQKMLLPVHQVLVDNVPALTIYKNDKEYLKQEFKKEISVLNNLNIKPKKNYIEIDLKEALKVTALHLQNRLPTCSKKYSQFIDEYIEFDSGKKFGLQERKIKKEIQELVLLFPAEVTRYIKIYPLDKTSCFTSGVITNVSYISK